VKQFFIQKNSVLLLLGIIVVVSASLAYLIVAGNAFFQPRPTATPTAQVPSTPLAALTEAPQPKACSSTHRSFQMGVAFPQWGPTAYGESDAKWLTELPEMQAQTAACWVEIPLLFYQSSLSSTAVTQGPSTPSLSSFNYGIHLAHALGLRVFVTPLLQVDGPQPWSGAIKFSTVEQERQWFASYWQAIKPYAVAAAQAGVEQFALGSEYEWLQENAPDSLWNGLISNIRSVFPGTLTYDMNWTTLQTQPPAWMRNPGLKMIGVSAYLPVIDTPERVDPQRMFGLWKQTVKTALDNFAAKLGEPIFISEIGYRNSADALYHSWESTSSAPLDPAEQAAACDAALANILTDQHILGSFFWGWDDAGAFNLNGLQAATVIHKYYASLQS
jgi:hypothetical protein